MKIDSHQHFWKYNPETYSWIPDDMSVIRRDFKPEDLQPELHKNSFSGCLAVQADQSEEETEQLLKLALEYDIIKGVVGWVDLSSTEVMDRLQYFSQNLFFKGVRHTEWDKKGEFMKASGFQKGIAALENFGLTYDILAFDYQLESAIELVRTFPDQKFVVDHMGKPKITSKPDPEWERNIATLGQMENVWCKVSGLVTETENFSWKVSDFFPFLQTVTEAFGVDRLMFGSDWPVCLSAATYEEVIEIVQEFFSSYSEEEKARIFGKNAAEFYNLKME